MTQVVRVLVGMGLVMGVGALPAAAQALALPASDPVGIARSGAQVAFGYSLEAAASNPALLASLKEKGGFYLSSGLEVESSMQSLESTQVTTFSHNRNRAIGAFGLASRLSPTLSLGLKLDQPFMRHGSFPDGAPSRFLGDGIDLATHRLEGQLALALSPNVSVGVGFGVARLSYESTNVMRLGVPNTTTGLTDGLVEQRVGQSGNKVVPSYSLGLRWAISPRWTMGFAHQSGLKGDVNLKAEYHDAPLGYYDNTGLARPLDGIIPRAAVLLAASTPTAGSPTLELPSRTTFGFRHRATPMVTWEADLRWTSAALRAPGFASVITPTGTVVAPVELPRGKSYLGVGASVEVDLGKFWTLRGGLNLDQRSIEEGSIEPLFGGAATSAFSIGAGYKVWGGELNLGYQYRQSQDHDTRRLDGVWSSTGFRSVGSRMRVEGMGHLLALGFKKTF